MHGPADSPMRLNRFETMLMNNPVRAWLQRRVSARRLLAMERPKPGGRMLEVGCGRGVGVEILLRDFLAGRVEAFDVDARMLRRARRRLSGLGAPAPLWVGDATAIPVPDGRYDGVAVFAVLHHVPDWRAALREIARVLKPGGRLYAEEIFARWIERFPWRQLLRHPRGDRFDGPGFVRGLEEAGLHVLHHEERHGEMGWFIAERSGSAAGSASLTE